MGRPDLGADLQSRAFTWRQAQGGILVDVSAGAVIMFDSRIFAR